MIPQYSEDLNSKRYIQYIKRKIIEATDDFIGRPLTVEQIRDLRKKALEILREELRAYLGDAYKEDEWSVVLTTYGNSGEIIARIERKMIP
jgi:hypothetical protein